MGSSPNALYQYARFVLDRINTVVTKIRHNRSAILSLATSCLIIASAHGYAAGVNSNVPISAGSYGAPLSVSLQSIIPSDTSSLTEQSAWHEKSRDSRLFSCQADCSVRDDVSDGIMPVSYTHLTLPTNLRV